MKELLGIFIIVQAILTGLILYGLNTISDSIIMAAAHQKNPINTLAWGGGLNTSTYILLGVIVIVGAYLIVVKDKKVNEIAPKLSL
ncbi:hypothetical protein [Bacillus sp. X1(2014)]|uniref:hypothetical protein n=1 Tax=Bacillus sp. X1(2014) TaxID=1565991 RepID=UPI0011A81F62|nr:hypothetical protein [Bacillus sp. X1(2014)]